MATLLDLFKRAQQKGLPDLAQIILDKAEREDYGQFVEIMVSQGEARSNYCQHEVVKRVGDKHLCVECKQEFCVKFDYEEYYATAY